MAKQKEEKETKESTKGLSREEKIKLATTALEKSIGKGILYRLGKGEKVPEIPRISFGVPSLDFRTGGGCPKGRIIEVIGPESTGKTTFSLELIAEAQKQGLSCLFVDAEHALSLKYAKDLGVCVEDLLVSQPDKANDALAVVETMIETGAADLVIYDSVPALETALAEDNAIGKGAPGDLSRLMSESLKRLNTLCQKTGATIVFINQIRMKIGIMFGNPETTPGGNALKFYASLRIDLRPGEKVSENETVMARKTRVKVIKSKVCPPFGETEVTIHYGTGVDKIENAIDLLKELGVIASSGRSNTLASTGESLGSSKKDVYKHFEANPAQLEALLKAELNKQIVIVPSVIEEESEPASE